MRKHKLTKEESRKIEDDRLVRRLKKNEKRLKKGKKSGRVVEFNKAYEG